MPRYSLFKLMCTFLVVSLSPTNVSAQKKNQALIDSVACYICAAELEEKEIVMRQAMLESGWCTSQFLMSRKNLFGFRHKEYLRFDSWQESVDYYVQWQKKRYTNPDEDYYTFLKRIKYGSTRYTETLKKIKYTLNCNCSE